MLSVTNEKILWKYETEQQTRFAADFKSIFPSKLFSI